MFIVFIIIIIVVIVIMIIVIVIIIIIIITIIISFFWLFLLSLRLLSIYKYSVKFFYMKNTVCFCMMMKIDYLDQFDWPDIVNLNNLCNAQVLIAITEVRIFELDKKLFLCHQTQTPNILPHM